MNPQQTSSYPISRRQTSSSREVVTIVIPCFNEEESIAGLRYALTELEADLGLQYDLQFIVVDDGSSDNTVWNLRIEFDNWDNLTILEHEMNEGVAAAIMTGIAHADSEIVASMDFDCSYNPVQFGAMLPLLKEEVDMVTASPYHPEGTVRSIPAWRLGLSKAASRLYGYVIKPKLHTYTSCFRVYRRTSVIGLDIRNSGFVGVAELVVRLDQRGGQIVECPATLDVRQFGQSKMNVFRAACGHLRLLSQAAVSRLLRRESDNREFEPEKATCRV
jgi:glycosyltransferase involved in cell wall biosynthesis